MRGEIEEEECRFFDAYEEIVSCSNESSSSSSVIISGDLQYDVWIKSPGNAEERREKFLNWMGVSNVVSETRFKSEDEFSSCRCDSSVISLMENNVDRIVEKSLCKEEEEEVDVSSGMVLRNLDFVDDVVVSSSLCSGSTSSGLTDRIELKSSNPMILGGIMKRVKEKWLSRLKKVRKGDPPDDGEVAVFGNRIERVKVKEYKKEAKELSALFKGQEIQAHEGAILAMKFSPDGRYLASAGEDGVLRVWSVVEDERSDEHDVPKMDPSCIYFEVSKLSELRPIAVEKEGVTGSLMSPRKRTESACVIIPPKIFRVLDNPVHEFLGHSGDILDISWSRNNKTRPSCSFYDIGGSVYCQLQ